MRGYGAYTYAVADMLRTRSGVSFTDLVTAHDLENLVSLRGRG
jgi:hypothetical protein